MLRPGSVGMQGYMVIRLRPCMIMSTPPSAFSPLSPRRSFVARLLGIASSGRWKGLPASLFLPVSGLNLLARCGKIVRRCSAAKCRYVSQASTAKTILLTKALLLVSRRRPGNCCYFCSAQNETDGGTRVAIDSAVCRRASYI